VSLYPTINPPALDEVPSDRPIAVGLNLLIKLYKIIDDTFIDLWRGVHAHVNPVWFTQVQQQLSEAIPAYLKCTAAQAVEIRITQQWLKAMAWQLCDSQGFVSSVTNENCMTSRYPIEISRDLLPTVHQFSQQAMEVHGAELVCRCQFLSFLDSLFCFALRSAFLHGLDLVPSAVLRQSLVSPPEHSFTSDAPLLGCIAFLAQPICGELWTNISADREAI
jgi:hypothetical protein